MKTKKFLLTLFIVFIALFIFGATKVNAVTEYEENLIYKIAPDGENATLKMIKPTDEGEFYIILENVLNELLNEDEYEASAYATNDELTSCVVYISNSSNEVIGTYNINVNYDEPEENEVVNSILSKMKIPNNLDDLENFYYVSDLNLINLYMIGNLWEKNEANHLKFSKDFIEISDGSDVSFYLKTRAGYSGGMFSYAVGDMSLFYDDYCYKNIMTGIYLKNVLYIPENTNETADAYVEAAQKRINDYLGSENEVKVTYGGTLDSLEDLEGINFDGDVVQRERTDGNYYNVAIEGETYKFYIMKGSDEQLEKPKYKGKHIKSDIKITTEDVSVPLDTHLIVETVKSEEIKNAIGTDIYDAYDIKLYSNTKNVSITKLNNGKFLVSIPVSSSLNGKNIITYYLNSNNELEEYETVVKDEVASFETDHFSTYILAEKKINVEKTYKLILDANEGEFSDGKTKLEFEDVTKCDITEIEKPVKEGCTFKGWYTEKNGGISIEVVMSSEEGIKEDTTFYAQWKVNSINEGDLPIQQPKDEIQTGDNNNNIENTINDNINNVDATNGKNPQTSDNILFFTVMLFISLIGVIATFKYRKYSDNK